MSRLKIAYRFLALAAAVAFLVSCSTRTLPAETAHTQTPQPSAVSVTGSPMPAVSGTEQPKPTQTPPPKGLQHPLPAPTPAPVVQPASAPLKAGDYYPVWQNGREGVVDRNGKVVIPFNFVEISSDSFAQDSSCYYGKAMFFCIPVQAGEAGARRLLSGYLYNADGKMVTSARLSNASVIGPDIVQVKKANYSNYISDTHYDEEDDYEAPSTPAEANVYGAILYSGKLILPYQYMEIYQFGKTAAAVKMVSDTQADVDFYDLKGKLLRTMRTRIQKEEGGYIWSDAQSYGNDLVLCDADGKYGILNDRLEWVAPEEWDGIESGLDGQFIVKKANLVGVMDAAGKLMIPCAYGSIPDSDRNTENGLDYTMDQYYTLRDAAGFHVLDRTGKELIQLDHYNHLEFSNGVIIAQNTIIANYSYNPDRSDLYDLQGNLLISLPDDINVYYPEAGYFNGYRHVYNSNGDALPLPSGYTQFVTADRFIVSPDSNESGCGLCDARGNWVIQPTYQNLTYIGGNVLVYDVSMGDDYYNPDTEGSDMYGLMDLEGKVLTDPIFYEFDNYDMQELFYVYSPMVSGLMDNNLHWVWKTSAYDGLDD